MNKIEKENIIHIEDINQADLSQKNYEKENKFISVRDIVESNLNSQKNSKIKDIIGKYESI